MNVGCATPQTELVNEKGTMDGSTVRVLWTLLLCAGLAGIALPGRAATVEYIHTDALGSPVAVTNSAGAVIERREYEPYGRQLSPVAVSDGPGFTGHVSDASTGLDYMQQRYYDPAIGRFLSVDPVTADDHTGANFNRYKYASNNPYRFIDPDGRQACGKSTTCQLAQGATGGTIQIAGRRESKSSSEATATIGTIKTVYSTEEEAEAAGKSEAKAANEGKLFPQSFLTLVSPLDSSSGFIYQNFPRSTGMPPMMGMGGDPTPAMLARALRMLQQNGVKSVMKAMASAENRISEHRALIEIYRKAGGYTSSMEREIRAWEREVQAYKSVLGGGK